MDVGSRTDVGRSRDRNEDALLVAPDRGLLAVADGMGGHPAGDVASKIAVDTIDRGLTQLDCDDGLDSHRVLTDALLDADEAIVDNGRQHPDRQGMGTTVVVTHVCEEEADAWIAHAGDSRAYRVNGGHLRQLTEDHSSAGLFGGGITQALGFGDVSPDVRHLNLKAGDRIVLCTDGLTNMISDGDIEAVLADTPGAQAACDQLIEAAINAGGIDNVTIIVIDIDAL